MTGLICSKKSVMLVLLCGEIGTSGLIDANKSLLGLMSRLLLVDRFHLSYKASHVECNGLCSVELLSTTENGCVPNMVETTA